TLATLLPTVVRSSLFPEMGGGASGIYPFELQNDSFNATSFYAPLISDFGWFGAGLTVCGIQAICAYVHVRAKRGSYYYSLLYPALFVCVVLSVFDMFFFALVTVCYPLLVSLFIRYRNARLRRRNHQRFEADSGAEFIEGPSLQPLQ